MFTICIFFCVLVMHLQRVLDLHWNNHREQIEQLFAPVKAPEAVPDHELVQCPGTRMKAHPEAIR